MHSTSLNLGYCQVAFLRVACRLQALVLGVCLVLSTGAVAAPKFFGGVELQAEAGDSATPVVAAEIVYIEDFTLNVVEEAAPSGPLARLAQRLPRPSAAEDAQTQARETVERMSVELVKSLSQQGFVAQRLVNNGKLPGSGWLIQGVFVSVDEGSRVKRAAIGFTSGASTMSVQATVSDLAGSQPVEPFLVLGTQKSPSKMPGAIVTKNAYVAAAKLVIEKNATPKDLRMTAEKIAEELLKYRQRLGLETADQ